MSRKDTIIVAVLLNAGLLVVLFVSALKNDPTPKIAATPPAPPPVVAKPPPSPKVVKPVAPVKPVVADRPKKVETPKQREVQVQKGDVLEKIAKVHNVSVSGIMKLNNLSSTSLQIGQVLKIPDSKVAPAEPQKEVEAKFYIVKEGDNPWLIAQKHGMRTADLLKLNDMNEEKAKKIRPGHKLRVK